MTDSERLDAEEDPFSIMIASLATAVLEQYPELTDAQAQVIAASCLEYMVDFLVDKGIETFNEELSILVETVLVNVDVSVYLYTKRN